MFLLLLFVMAPLSGCFGESNNAAIIPSLEVDESNSTVATRGQTFTLNVTSNVDWTISRSPGVYFMDEFGVHRTDVNFTLPASQNNVSMLVLDTERETIELQVTAGTKSGTPP